MFSIKLVSNDPSVSEQNDREGAYHHEMRQKYLQAKTCDVIDTTLFLSQFHDTLYFRAVTFYKSD